MGWSERGGGDARRLVEMQCQRSPQAEVMTETRGPVKTGPLVSLTSPSSGRRLNLHSLLELPRSTACLRQEDRDEARRRVAVRVERHRHDDAVGDVRLEQP